MQTQTPQYILDMQNRVNALNMGNTVRSQVLGTPQIEMGPGVTYNASTSTGGGPGTTVNGGLGGTTSRPGSSVTVGAQPVNVDTLATPYGGGMPSGGGAPTGGSNPMGAMPTEMMTMYKNFLSDPSQAQNNPMYKAMMDAGLQGTERAQLAGGMQGSGNILAELQKTGMGVAGQYLPTMANMYGQGAGMEADRWSKENAGNVGAGTLDLNQWKATADDQFRRAQANYGMGQDARAMNIADTSNAQFAPLMQQYMTMAASGY